MKGPGRHTGPSWLFKLSITLLCPSHEVTHAKVASYDLRQRSFLVLAFSAATSGYCFQALHPKHLMPTYLQSYAFPPLTQVTTHLEIPFEEESVKDNGCCMWASAPCETPDPGENKWQPFVIPRFKTRGCTPGSFKEPLGGYGGHARPRRGLCGYVGVPSLGVRPSTL